MSESPEERGERVYQLFQKGSALLEAGDFAAAAIPLEQARDLEPDKTSIREALGRAYFRSGRFEQAREEFAAVVERSPVDHYSHFCLGRALEKTGQPRRGPPPRRPGRGHAARPRGLPGVQRDRAASQPELTVEEGGAELLDVVQPLWLSMFEWHRSLPPEASSVVPALPADQALDAPLRALSPRAGPGAGDPVPDSRGEEAVAFAMVRIRPEGEASFATGDGVVELGRDGGGALAPLPGARSLLLRRVHEWAASQGIGFVSLSVMAGNEEAERFYRRFGMERSVVRMLGPVQPPAARRVLNCGNQGSSSSPSTWPGSRRALQGVRRKSRQLADDVSAERVATHPSVRNSPTPERPAERFSDACRVGPVQPGRSGRRLRLAAARSRARHRALARSPSSRSSARSSTAAGREVGVHPDLARLGARRSAPGASGGSTTAASTGRCSSGSSTRRLGGEQAVGQPQADVERPAARRRRRARSGPTRRGPRGGVAGQLRRGRRRSRRATAIDLQSRDAALVQRVSEAAVSVGRRDARASGRACWCCSGSARGDTAEQADRLAAKARTLRVFEDALG